MQNLKTLLSCLWIIKSDIWWIISSLISLLSETGFCLLITCIISWRDGNEPVIWVMEMLQHEWCNGIFIPWEIGENFKAL